MDSVSILSGMMQMIYEIALFFGVSFTVLILFPYLIYKGFVQLFKFVDFLFRGSLTEFFNSYKDTVSFPRKERKRKHLSHLLTFASKFSFMLYYGNDIYKALRGNFLINNQVDSRKFEVFKLSNPKLFNEAIFSENIQTEQIKEGSWAMIGKHKGYDLLIIGEEYISIDADGGSSDEVRTVIKMLFENNLKHKMHVSKREPVIIEFLKTPLKSFKRLLPNQNPFSAMSEIKKPDLHTAVSGDPKFYKKVEISGEEIRKISLLLQDVDLQNKILTLLEFFPSTIIDDSGIISHIGDLLSERGEYKLAKGLEILTDVAEAFKKNADRCNTMQF